MRRLPRSPLPETRLPARWEAEPRSCPPRRTQQWERAATDTARTSPDTGARASRRLLGSGGKGWDARPGSMAPGRGPLPGLVAAATRGHDRDVHVRVLGGVVARIHVHGVHAGEVERVAVHLDG